MADIQDSTQLVRELPAEESLAVTGRWICACTQIIGDHDGAINKFLGDGFLAYWPDGPRVADSVAETLLGLKKLQEEVSPRFRMVVHFGQVSAGGAASLGEESLAGNEVNLVFRMEKLAASLGAARLLTEPAQAQIKSLLPTTPEGRHTLPGFPGDFSFFSF